MDFSDNHRKTKFYNLYYLVFFSLSKISIKYGKNLSFIVVPSTVTTEFKFL